MSKIASNGSEYPPRGLGLHEAARYIGIGISKFKIMIDDGRMPHPVKIDGRNVWDRVELDAAFDDLPRAGAGVLDDLISAAS